MNTIDTLTIVVVILLLISSVLAFVVRDLIRRIFEWAEEFDNEQRRAFIIPVKFCMDDEFYQLKIAVLPKRKGYYPLKNEQGRVFILANRQNSLFHAMGEPVLMIEVDKIDNRTVRVFGVEYKFIDCEKVNGSTPLYQIHE